MVHELEQLEQRVRWLCVRGSAIGAVAGKVSVHHAAITALSAANFGTDFDKQNYCISGGRNVVHRGAYQSTRCVVVGCTCVWCESRLVRETRVLELRA